MGHLDGRLPIYSVLHRILYVGAMAMNELVLSMPDALEKFLRLSVADGDARVRTIEAYRQSIGYYIEWCRYSEIDPISATHDDLLKYRSVLVQKYKRATIRLRLCSVRLLYKSLCRWAGRADDPSAGVRAPKSKEDSRSNILSKSLSPEQARILLSSLGDSRDDKMIRLMLTQGIRVGEIVALRSDDLSPDRSHISIPGKGGKRRTLVLNYQCREDVADAKSGPLFSRRGGGHLSVRSVERAVNSKLMSLGMKEYGKSAHSLRHAYALCSVLGGAGREALADSMGHSSISVTDVYCRAAAAYQGNPSDAALSVMGETKS